MHLVNETEKGEKEREKFQKKKKFKESGFYTHYLSCIYHDVPNLSFTNCLFQLATKIKQQLNLFESSFSLTETKSKGGKNVFTEQTQRDGLEETVNPLI